jgi:hypothetical protein
LKLAELEKIRGMNMRLIGTAIVAAAALTLVTAGAASARHHHHHHGMYKFCVQCPVGVPMPWTKGTCSAAGKTRDAARDKCQQQNNFCYIRNYSHKTCK